MLPSTLHPRHLKAEHMTLLMGEFGRTHLACMGDLLTYRDSSQVLAKCKLFDDGRLHISRVLYD